jgi:hypothetical protein
MKSESPWAAQGIVGAVGIGLAIPTGSDAAASERDPRKARFFCGQAAKKCANMTAVTEEK